MKQRLVVTLMGSFAVGAWVAWLVTRSPFQTADPTILTVISILLLAVVLGTSRAVAVRHVCGAALKTGLALIPLASVAAFAACCGVYMANTGPSLIDRQLALRDGTTAGLGLFVVALCVAWPILTASKLCAATTRAHHRHP